ncbi:MAG: branched-chain amino acid ABC transporter permease, partial [Candidatus Limnocylindrales bacterium]
GTTPHLTEGRALTAVTQPVDTTGRRFPQWVVLSVSAVIFVVLFTIILTFEPVLGGGPPDLATATQQTANALSLGAIYALIALGYTMVYGIIELINFAHGDLFMVGAFVSMTFTRTGFSTISPWGTTVGRIVLGGLALFLAWGLISGLGIRRAVPRLAALGAVVAAAIGLEIGLHATGPNGDIAVLGLVLVPAFLIAMILIAATNVTIERLAYRPLRRASRLAPLLTAVGVSYVLQNIVQIWQGTGDRPVPQLVPLVKFELLGAKVNWLNLFILVLALALMLGLQAFVSRTRLGRAMRSTAQDQQAAQLMGVDLNQTISITFLIGGALAGAAGVFQGLYFGFVRFDLGFNAGLKAFTSAVLGGIGNLTGAVIGGFLIGFVEVFAAASGQQRWSQAIVFVVLIVVLIVRPSGILGQQVSDRA